MTDGTEAPERDDDSDGVEVVDEVAQNRFVVRIEGAEAELVYRREPGRLVLVHTGVPDELGGRGVGSALVRAAVDSAVRGGLTVAPWCPFARKWLEDHPEVAGLVELDLAPPPGR